MQQRYYDPGIPRFLSVDPVTVNTVTGWNFCRYCYAANNPYKFTDPDGRSIWTKLIKLVVKGGDVAATTAGLVSDAKTVANPNASVGERILAGASIVSEALPVSVGDVKDGAKIVDGLLKKSPDIHPSEVAGRTPAEIDAIATDRGLIPRGSNPSSGQGSYVDPATGNQRVLVHPNADCGPHCHVNNADGQRLDMEGNVVPPESPEAHLPLRTEESP